MVVLRKEVKTRIFTTFFMVFLIKICTLFILAQIIQVVPAGRTRTKRKRVDLEAPGEDDMVDQEEEETTMLDGDLVVEEIQEEEDLLNTCIICVRTRNAKTLMSITTTIKCPKWVEVILCLAAREDCVKITLLRLPRGLHLRRITMIFPLTRTVGMIPPMIGEMVLMHGMIGAKGAADAVS